jgi:AraC-like DNA-binding protein
MHKSSNSSMPRLIRWAHPLGFAASLKETGVPVEKYFRKHGLPTLCEDPDVFLPLLKVWSFWDEVAHQDDPLLGWRVGRIFGEQLLSGSFLQQLEQATTLYQALQTCIRLIKTEATHLQLGILERPDDILFYTHYPDLKGAPGHAISQAYQLEVYLTILRLFLGRDWLPEEIGHETPEVPATLHDHLPVPRIRTDRRMGYIKVPRSCLHVTARQNTAAMNTGTQTTHPPTYSDRFDYVDTLSSLIKAYMSDGYPSRKRMASLMDTSVRSMVRQLAARNLTYRSLVDAVRFNKARELLNDNDASIADISGATGFEDPAHFSRMFRRVGGISPTNFRKVNRRTLKS